MPSLVDGNRRAKREQVTHRFDYHDDDGNVVVQKCRIELPDGGKTFRQRQRVFDVYGYRGDLTPYQVVGVRHLWVDHIDESLKALPYRPDEQQKLMGDGEPRLLYIPEGERDVHAILDAGEVATTVLQAGCEKAWAEYLRGYRGLCLAVVDNDPVGAVYGLAKRSALIAVGVKVELLRPPEGYKDVRDMLEDGKPLSALQTVTVGELEKIARRARQGISNGNFSNNDEYPAWVLYKLSVGKVKVGRKLVALPKQERR